MTHETTRRDVLKGAGAAAAAVGASAALTACGGGGQSSSASKPSTASAPVTVPKDQVQLNNGVVLEKTYVVTQPTEGEYKAFDKICPHGGCNVSFIKNKQIVCACHGSEFSIVDGSRTAGPAKQGLKEYPVKAEGDNLTIG